MNVLRNYVRRTLRENRSRTLVTVIGIVLSIALVTAVIEGAYSAIAFMRRSEEERVGAFHGFAYRLSEQEMNALREDPEIDSAAAWQEVGWAQIESENPYKPYLLLESVDGDFENLVSVHLLSGRMPENENEILLPAHLAENGGASYKEGDTLRLSLGRRLSEGYELSAHVSYLGESQEELTDTIEKTYTVCGIYKQFSTELEPYSSPAFLALTKGGGTGSFGLFFTVKHPGSYYSYITEKPFLEESEPHSDLLGFYGSLRNNELARVLYNFAAILIFLIGFGSVSLIYNSFSISVSQRTKQFGILKSVGATKKQIRACVFYEALLLSAFAIPAGLFFGCLGIGATLYFLRDSFAGFLSTGSETQMGIVVSPAALLIAAALGLITTLLSAWVPALRAMHTSPMESIRQANDLKAPKEAVKTSKLTYRLFGLEGMLAAKHFKRNRKRYRSVIVSLFLSVVLFICASSLCSYLSDLVNGVTANRVEADLIYSEAGKEEDPEEILRLLSSAKGVKEAEYEAILGRTLVLQERDFTERMREVFPHDPNEDALFEAYLCFLRDDTFRALLRENGLSQQDYFDADSPRGLLINEMTVITQEAGKDATWERIPVLQESAFPMEICYTEYRTIEGYEYYGQDLDENGEIVALYYPEEYLWEYYRSDTSQPLDMSKAMRIPQSEAQEKTPLLLGDAIGNSSILIPRSMIAVVYPFSMAQALGEDSDSLHEAIEYAFTVENHKEAYEEMKKLLSDAGISGGYLNDLNESKEAQRMLVRVVRVFSYGFIILISLIAASNVFNTISTSIALRRREFAMLRSIGMNEKGFRKMTVYECIIYGAKALLWGLPAAFLMTYLIYRAASIAYREAFYIPLESVLIAIGSVFLVVFASTLYATAKIRRENPIDALKNENA